MSAFYTGYFYRFSETRTGYTRVALTLFGFLYLGLIMLLTKSIRIKINKDAKEYLEFASERCRLVYNFALAEKIEYYKKRNKTLSTYEQKKQLPALKKKYPEYAKVYNKCLTAMYFRLDKAYKNFYRRVKTNEEKKGFPKFKRKGQFISQEYPAMYIRVLDEHRFVVPTGRGQENIIARTYEPVPKNFKTVTITKKKSRYFVSFLTEIKEKKFKNNKKVIAFDLGVKTLAIGFNTSGKFIEIPKFSHHTKHLDLLRSKRDKKQKGSRRWKKLNKTFQKRLEQYLNRVKDYLHKASYWVCHLIESTIVVGDLNLENMKTEKSWFNRIIQNEWRVGFFVELLNYKCTKFGKKLVKIDERNTTKTCSQCKYIQEMKLSDRTYTCPKCGLRMNRDKNSAINILKKYCTASALPVKVKGSVSVSLSNRFVYT